MRRHIAPALGKLLLTKLGPQHVQGFIKDKLAPRPCGPCGGTGKEPGKHKEKKDCRACRGNGSIRLSPRSVQYMHSVLSRALNRAVKWDLVPRNVCKLVSPPRVPRHPVEPLSPEEARRLLTAINGDRNEALYSVAMALGLRKGEALGLRWSDIDLEAETLHVRHALQRLKGKRELVEPKSERSRRTLPLPAFAVKVLRAHRAHQMQERLLAGSRWQEGGYVFTSTIGTPMDERNVSRLFKVALAKAGIAPKRFHDLRHTAASLLLAQGVHPRTVMETLGHSQISLTLNTYSHVLPSVLREAADKMEAIIGGRG